MKRSILILSAFLLALPAFAKGPARPKLVVGIVVDQMRWDYLYRYYDRYGADGFKCLMRDGFRCEQTVINYLPSYTAPGHTCIYTGSVPAIHGIAGNEWLEGGKFTYCTDDKSVMPVGGSMKWGQMSPRNLLTTTVTDELRLATNFRSRVFGISLKDRSSILPAGHTGKAFWFDDSTGNFATSTYYGQTLPQWVTRFNARRWADTILAKDWSLLDDAATYTQSEPNNGRYEGLFDKAEPLRADFPHEGKYFMGKGALKYNSVRKLPGGNWLTLQFAKRCIAANALGQGPDADFLTVSLSATDYAGHQFGPNAVELEDMYRRLDCELARFLKYLDEEVGVGKYTIFLTADHGAAHNSLYLNDKGIPAGNVSEGDFRKELNAFLKKETGKDSLVQSLENYQVYFSEAALKGAAFDDKLKLQLMTMMWLRKRPEVAFALDLDLNGWNQLPQPIQQMAVNGFYRPRSGAIQIILKPGYYAGYAPTGTTHGTWNPYDTHIPLLWYGWGIPKGETHREVYMTDIAATVAALLHIQMPNGCVGKPITELVR